MSGDGTMVDHASALRTPLSPASQFRRARTKEIELLQYYVLLNSVRVCSKQ